MAIFSWFAKKEPEDYEQILSSLALDIQKRQTRLSEIRLRERRTTLIFTIYAFAMWTVYVGLWYGQLLPNTRRIFGGWEKMVKFLPLLLGPILIQFTRRIVQAWYGHVGNAEEKTLKALLAQQRNKVEEIKKKTNYYSTKTLLERYDSPSGPPATASTIQNDQNLRRRGKQQQQQQQPQQPPVTPQRPAGANMVPQTPVQAGQLVAQSPLQLAGGYPMTPAQPFTPPRKQWYDKLADALLGDDETGGSPSNRYALICQKCFAHNGLVKEEGWEDAQYVCPKCGFFNPSRRSLKTARRSISPTASPASPISPRQHAGYDTSPESSNRRPRQISSSPPPSASAGDMSFEHLSPFVDKEGVDKLVDEGNSFAEKSAMEVDNT